LILTVTDDTHLTLQSQWQGTLPSGATYVLIKMSWLRYEPALMQAKLRELLAELEGAGNFIFTAVDPPDPALGQDGDFALKTDVVPWQLWLKTGGVWVEQAPAGSAIADDQVTPPMLDADTAAKQEAFRVRLAAAPFDALAYNGMQVNGSMEVSQETGSFVAITYGKYLLDGWKVYTAGTQALSGGKIPNAVAGFPSAAQIIVGTANASPAVGDYVIFAQPIEGFRVSRLAWGNVAASPITVGFWMAANRAGTYSGSVRNAASNRSYVFNITINVAATFEYKTVTIPGDTTGTWEKETITGLDVGFCMMCGIGLTTTPGVWTAGSFLGATGTINGVAATSDWMAVTGVIVLPGTQAPTAAQSPLVMRPYDQELVTCHRYYWRGSGFQLRGVVLSGVGVVAMAMTPLASFRAVPTLTVSGNIEIIDGANHTGNITAVNTNSSQIDVIAFNPAFSGGTGFPTAGAPIIVSTVSAGILSADARL
jgi:hypothetical protein